MTVRELFQVAEERRLLDAQIRICDGMAVSFYPEPSCIMPAHYEVVIDVSALPVIEYDELMERLNPAENVEA